MCGLLHSFLHGAESLQSQVRGIWNAVVGIEDGTDDDQSHVDEQARFGRLGLLYKCELLL